MAVPYYQGYFVIGVEVVFADAFSERSGARLALPWITESCLTHVCLICLCASQVTWDMVGNAEFSLRGFRFSSSLFHCWRFTLSVSDIAHT